MPSSIIDQLIVILTNFVIYLTFHPDFKNQIYNAAVAIGDGLYQDVFSPQFPLPEAAYWSIQEQIENRGYRYEEHKIQTEDGYILTAFRVPGKTQSNGAKNPPVLLQHGLLDDAGTWFFNNQTLDLSLELVEQGFDIWATNSRGTVYSNQHIKYNTSDDEFWNFTLHDMGKYDVPANLHYVRNYTGFDQVIYFGHSQGTTQYFIANALNQDLAQYYKAFIGLAPVAYVYYANGVAVTLLQLLQIPELLDYFFDSVLYLPGIQEYAVPFLHYFPRFVWNIVQTVVGFDKNLHLDLSSLPMMGANDVGGTSTKNLVHWIQMVRSGYFRQYDYGSDMNMQVYGQNYPPEYDLSTFKTNLENVKMLLFVGGNDVLVNQNDFKKLLGYLPSDVTTKSIQDYNHLDYMWAADVNQYVNGDVLQFIQQFKYTERGDDGFFSQY